MVENSEPRHPGEHSSGEETGPQGSRQFGPRPTPGPMSRAWSNLSAVLRRALARPRTPDHSRQVRANRSPVPPGSRNVYDSGFAENGNSDPAEEERLEEEPVTLGGTLFEAREDYGLTIEQVATELRVETPLLEALEEDRLEVFAAPVFVKGYLRHLAERYDLDHDDLLEKYARQQGDTSEYAPVLHSDSLGTPNPMLVPLGIAGAVLIIGIPALWFTWNSRDSLSEIFSSGPETSVSPPVAIEPVLTGDQSAEPVIDPVPSVLTETPGPEIPIDSGPVDDGVSPETEPVPPPDEVSPNEDVAPPAGAGLPVGTAPPDEAPAAQTAQPGPDPQAPATQPSVPQTPPDDGADELPPPEDDPAVPSENTAASEPVDIPPVAPQEEEPPGAQ